MGVSENSVPLNPMVLLIIIPIKWLFVWEYTLFSDKPILDFSVPTGPSGPTSVAKLAHVFCGSLDSEASQWTRKMAQRCLHLMAPPWTFHHLDVGQPFHLNSGLNGPLLADWV